MTVTRGCGTRVRGGVYSCTYLSKDGAPLEDFLFDPPRPVEITLPSIGVTTVQIKDGDPWHILDRVGSQHYPNVADFVEEVRRFGMSRRLPKSMDFGKLSTSSRHLLAHDRALMTNVSDVYGYLENDGHTPYWRCPKKILEHDSNVEPALFPFEMCSGLWWNDVREGDIKSEAVPGDPRVLRVMPSFAYTARNQTAGRQVDYRLAFFLWLPIHKIEVVGGPDADETANRLEEQTSLPVSVEES